VADDLRELAERVVARGYAHDSGVPVLELARGYLRLLTDLKLARHGHVSDKSLDAQRERYERTQAEIELSDKRWGAVVSDAIDDIDQLRLQRDQFARWKAAAEATLRDWQTAADEAADGIAGWGVEDWMTNFEAQLRLAAPPASTPPAG
jgi:hypothetical protein